MVSVAVHGAGPGPAAGAGCHRPRRHAGGRRPGAAPHPLGDQPAAARAGGRHRPDPAGAQQAGAGHRVRPGGAAAGPAGRSAHRRPHRRPRRRARRRPPAPAGDPGGAPAPEPMPTLPIAVNADSMATWVLPALAPLAGEVCFDLHREDQQHTSALLRAGTVMAAVTADAQPVPGCTATRLGGLRYRPMAAPGFTRRWFPAGPTAEALARAPVVVFDRHDDLQHRYLHTHAGPDAAPPVHYVPAAADYL